MIEIFHNYFQEKTVGILISEDAEFRSIKNLLFPLGTQTSRYTNLKLLRVVIHVVVSKYINLLVG
jgi:hypothetical protein